MSDTFLLENAITGKLLIILLKKVSKMRNRDYN